MSVDLVCRQTSAISADKTFAVYMLKRHNRNLVTVRTKSWVAQARPPVMYNWLYFKSKGMSKFCLEYVTLLYILHILNKIQSVRFLDGFQNFENIRLMLDWHIILKINVPLCNSTTCHVISWKTLQKHGNVKMMSQLFQQLSHWHSKGDWGSPQTTIKWLFFFCFAQNWVINGVCC